MKIYRLIFLPIFLIESSYNDQNNTDVIITYAGHSEAELGRPILTSKSEGPVIGDLLTTDAFYDATEAVVFVPNDKPVFRNEDVYSDPVRVHDLIEKDSIQNMMRLSKMEEQVKITDEPKEDIVFISGKNNENNEKPVQESARETHGDVKVVRPSAKKKKSKRLDCNNLDCNNTVQAVCGSREEDQKTKYRLFLNECFFRKVNCGFKNEANRYTKVLKEYCDNVGMHLSVRPFNPQNKYLPEKPIVQRNDTRRVLSSRRSLGTDEEGQPCSHICPVSCTEDYDPQCAATASGQKKVFLNHCKLDMHSCIHFVSWYRRPLSECVGTKKADIQLNRGFIGWMQRVGIVDKKGKLLIS